MTHKSSVGEGGGQVATACEQRVPITSPTRRPACWAGPSGSMTVMTGAGGKPRYSKPKPSDIFLAQLSSLPVCRKNYSCTPSSNHFLLPRSGDQWKDGPVRLQGVGVGPDRGVPPW